MGTVREEKDADARTHVEVQIDDGIERASESDAGDCIQTLK
jgi:hypothetical protein